MERLCGDFRRYGSELERFVLPPDRQGETESVYVGVCGCIVEEETLWWPKPLSQLSKPELEIEMRVRFPPFFFPFFVGMVCLAVWSVARAVAGCAAWS